MEIRRWTYKRAKLYAVRVKTDTPLDEVKVKVCQKVGIDFSKNTLIMKLLYLNYDQPMDVLDDETWLEYIDDILRKEVVKLCINVEPVLDDDHVENAFDLNEQVDEENSRGINDLTPDFDCNLNSREEFMPTPHENSSLQFDCPPYSEQPIISRQDAVIEVGTSRHNVSKTTFLPVYNQPEFDRTRQNVNLHDSGQHFDYPPPLIPSPMQGGLNISAGSFTSFLNTPLEHNPLNAHTFGMASINRNRGAFFGSDIPSVEIPQCPRVGALQNEDSGLLFIGKKFSDKEDMKIKMSYHALKNDYMWKIQRSDTEKLKLRCFTSDVCEWRVTGMKVLDSNNFVITSYNPAHTCGLELITSRHRQARPGPIGRLVRENLLKLGSQFMTKHLIVEVKRAFNVDLDYQRAYHCRMKALEIIGGTVKLSYSKLPAYFYMLKNVNLGTVTDIQVDSVTGRFKYCFLALKSSIDGFKFCRPVLVVDGTHLKTKCGGVLLVAVGVDAGDHIFPVAFAVTDGESAEAWTYFMLRLKNVIGERDDMVFISDRGGGIIRAVREVFPNAHHGFCYHHIIMNLNKKFTTTGYDPSLVWEAAYTFSQTQFTKTFQKIIDHDRDRPHEKKVYVYLEEIGFHRWARSHFPGTRYAIMTSNYAESFNNVIRDARKLSIVNMFDHIRATLQDWHFKRRELAFSCRTVLAPEPEKFLKDVSNARRTFTLTPIDQYEFQVGDIDTSAKVNMFTLTCYCGQFQGLQMPCVHACAAINQRCGSAYEYCSRYYKGDCFKNIYEGRVYPVPVEDDWILPESIINAHIPPPEPDLSQGGETQRSGARRGRPKILRIPSQGEPPGGRTSKMPNDKTQPGSSKKCSLCGNPGHKKPRCPYHTVAPH